jgi:hypothetical protein
MWPRKVKNAETATDVDLRTSAVVFSPICPELPTAPRKETIIIEVNADPTL